MSGTGIVTADAVEIRRSPSSEEPAVSRLLRSERVRVEEFVGDWARVRIKDVSGFVPVGMLALLGARGEDLLAADPALQDSGLEPPEERLVSLGTAEEAAVCRTWNLYGGLLDALSRQVGIDPASAVAVLCVESSGNAFGADGRMIIRFENHIFRRYLRSDLRGRFDQHFRVEGAQPWLGHRFRASPAEPWLSFHGSQALEWRVLAFARGLDDDAALKSISMGAPQIMGFNHEAVGYPTVRAMFEYFGLDVRYQILGLFDFLRGGPAARSPMLEALRRRDYDAFAARYNGPGQARYYGELIARHVEAFGRTHARASSGETGIPREVEPVAERSEEPVPATRTYQVRSGDTLGAIAGRFAVPLKALVAANRIDNPDLIRVGQTLSIPSGEPPPEPVAVPSVPADDVDERGEPLGERIYVVRAGDALSGIASRFGVTVSAIAQANRIANPDRIFPGQALVIPSRAP